MLQSLSLAPLKNKENSSAKSIVLSSQRWYHAAYTIPLSAYISFNLTHDFY